MAEPTSVSGFVLALDTELLAPEGKIDDQKSGRHGK